MKPYRPLCVDLMIKYSSFGINHLTEKYCLTIKILKIKKSLQEWRPQKTQMMKKNFIS